MRAVNSYPEIHESTDVKSGKPGPPEISNQTDHVILQVAKARKHFATMYGTD